MDQARPKKTNRSTTSSRRSRSSPERLLSMPITSYWKAPVYLRMNMPMEAVLPRRSVSPCPGPSSSVQSETERRDSKDPTSKKWGKSHRHSKHSRDRDRSRKRHKENGDASGSAVQHKSPRVSSGPRSPPASDDRVTVPACGVADVPDSAFPV
jgi:hypothetical protein